MAAPAAEPATPSALPVRPASAARRASRIRKVLFTTAAVAALLVGLVGFAHTRVGRPLLAMLQGAPGCPVMTKVDPAKLEAFRVAQVSRNRGDRPALSRPAMGFRLGTSTHREVSEALAARGVACRPEQQGSVLRCEKVGAPLSDDKDAPAVDDVYMQFDPSGVLVAVDMFRVGVSGGAVVRYLDQLFPRLEREVGAATDSTGELSHLESHAMGRVERAFRYSDYIARVSAMNYGTEGIRVREQYQWVPGAPGSAPPN